MRTNGQQWGGRVDGGLLVGASAAIGLSVTSIWWAVPAVGAAFLAGWRMERARPAVVLLVVLVAVGVPAALMVPGWMVPGTSVLSLVICAGMGPWMVGRFWRQSQELVRAGWELAERLEREQQLVAEQARLRERARIAQDMHDALGHDLSLIALRAGALKLAPDLAGPHREAAQEIRAGAGAAVERLAEVIGILRDDADGSSARGPADAGVAQLVEEAAAAGLDVGLTVTGEADGLPRAAEHAAFRVVQEALTNAAKHAPRAAVTVRVAHTPDGARVQVVNGPSPVDLSTGSPSTGSPSTGGPSTGGPSAVGPAAGAGGGGRGLIGLAERVRLAGGTFSHGPRAGGGGFEVSAYLPRSGAPVAAAVPVTVSPARELHHARRRVGRMMVAVVLVPLATVLVLTTVLRGWAVYTAGRAVLDPADYALLRVGQDRATVQRFLPERQFPYHPSAGNPPPRGEGVTCEYYAITAKPFNDDRSGDAYRLCFQGDVLISLDALIA
ncbi:histidine kinase [Kitasatospora sp. RG8]|uniref:sensor histidine kinase n=1 Tax=Kitasatospora sp. RG8 TaxID=2820815 RepID=UPI0027DD0EDE|nr:histidine kinase [Kitasatospora sp. RG8]